MVELIGIILLCTYTVHCILYTVQLYNTVHCTLYTVHKRHFTSWFENHCTNYFTIQHQINTDCLNGSLCICIYSVQCTVYVQCIAITPKIVFIIFLTVVVNIKNISSLTKKWSQWARPFRRLFGPNKQTI